MHPSDIGDQKLIEECDVERTRRQGPGGQHRNKVETAVVLRHRSTGLSAEANEKRSQADNLKAAVFRLRLALAIGVRTPRPPAASSLFINRVRAGKLQVNSGHQDFPSLIAEVLDRLAQHHYQIPATAKELGVSGSQILKFLKQLPAAFDFFNRQRESRHLPRIKF